MDDREGERILSFTSDITINRDSSLSIVDRIRVRAEGSQIRRGIYRDFDTTRQRDGGTFRIRIQVHSVTRNGQAETFVTDEGGGSMRVLIGRPEVLLPRGEHIYEVRYSVNGEVRFLGDRDEFFWIITGGGWAFPIDRAEAVIRLPRSVRFVSRTVLAGGPEGDPRRAEIASERPGEIRLRTTAPLNRGESFSVTLGWPRGVVMAPPPAATRR